MKAIERLYQMVTRREPMPAADRTHVPPRWETALDPTPRTPNEHGVAAARRDLLDQAAERARERRSKTP